MYFGTELTSQTFTDWCRSQDIGSEVELLAGARFHTLGQKRFVGLEVGRWRPRCSRLDYCDHGTEFMSKAFEEGPLVLVLTLSRE
jgi:hypothetical protein